MKSKIHAIAGVLGFLCIVSFCVSTLWSALLGRPETVAVVKNWVFWGMFLLLPALVGAGASGVSLLNGRTEKLAETKQKRGPIAFMTSLFVLLPSAYFLSSWAAEGTIDATYYGVQALELLASSVCIAMIGLNIRDGLALRGRINTRTEAPAEPRIECRGGGPLVALRVPSLAGANKASLKNNKVMALCRCGASKTKPYCDGSHNTIGFDSTRSEERTRDEVLVFNGREITVHYNRLLCSHAGECGKRKKAAFDSSRKPWIKPDNATKQEIMEVVKACPSGALRFSLPGDAPQHALTGDRGIVLEQDGPYRVSGIPLATPELATGASPDKYVLCRCGASKNKPFCDGTHFDIQWKSEPTP